MIIVEGPDGAGKTTFIRELQDRFPDLEVAPRVVSKDAEAMVDLKQWVEQNVADGFQYKIFDRHRLISETIYGPILRSIQEEGFLDANWVNQQMYQFYKIKPIIIYCLPPLKMVRSNIYDDQDNRVVWDHIESIYAAYVSRMNLDFIMEKALIFEYDYTLWTHSTFWARLTAAVTAAREIYK